MPKAWPEALEPSSQARSGPSQAKPALGLRPGLGLGLEKLLRCTTSEPPLPSFLSSSSADTGTVSNQSFGTKSPNETNMVRTHLKPKKCLRVYLACKKKLQYSSPGLSPSQARPSPSRGLGLGPEESQAQARPSQAQALAFRPSQALGITMPNTSHPMIYDLSLYLANRCRSQRLLAYGCIRARYIKSDHAVTICGRPRSTRGGGHDASLAVFGHFLSLSLSLSLTPSSLRRYLRARGASHAECPLAYGTHPRYILNSLRRPRFGEWVVDLGRSAADSDEKLPLPVILFGTNSSSPGNPRCEICRRLGINCQCSSSLGRIAGPTNPLSDTPLSILCWAWSAIPFCDSPDPSHLFQPAYLPRNNTTGTIVSANTSTLTSPARIWIPQTVGDPFDSGAGHIDDCQPFSPLTLTHCGATLYMGSHEIAHVYYNVQERAQAPLAMAQDPQADGLHVRTLASRRLKSLQGTSFDSGAGRDEGVLLCFFGTPINMAIENV
ncbi:hypothetical protein C8R47DRAFT_1076688 [Mycena vitilis]|nr:hypothetical protein C8R47DRAFT_1076688 [Mycena vitilis]